MDKFTKFTLGVIALSLVCINLQLMGSNIISPANAALDSHDYRMISNGISDIVSAIYSINISCNWYVQPNECNNLCGP